ncbi:hypothetical protein GCM10009087_18100 [Sphingomonas oligophenolica]|uniref:Benenodin family lasso peptide n=1 Tax=Sphingomonas oligophenolica TaxID=301154 RepID=A0ABU9Y3F3_9SPHN
MERANDLIDLGSASEETKGLPFPGVDERLGGIQTGLADD